MPTFITQGRFTQEALTGLVDEPEDRTQAVNGLMKAVGGRLIDYYVTFGEYDFLVISEAPNVEAVASAMLGAGSTHAVTNLKTTVAFSARDAESLFHGAQAARAGYRPPGGAV